MTAGEPDRTPRATYLAGLAAGELRYQHCDGCDQPFFYPRVLCPRCGGTDLRWQVSAGAGTVYSSTTVPGRPDKGIEPYSVVLVDLDEGIRIMSTVRDVAEPAIGLRVFFVAEPPSADGDDHRPVFVPEVSHAA